MKHRAAHVASARAQKVPFMDTGRLWDTGGKREMKGNCGRKKRK